MERILAVGCDGFMSKLFEIKKLKETVRALLHE